MIIHRCKQGSSEWQELRRGRPTASIFDRIVTPTGKLSKQSSDLMYKLAAERILGYPIDSPTTAVMDAGRYREPEARNWYGFEVGQDVEEVGICFNDAGTIGASPDGVVGNEGLLEIKCPTPQVHVRYLMDRGIGPDYWPQVQGQLWICERDWLDSVSYCPPFVASLVRVHRDEEYIAKLSEAVTEFAARLGDCEQALLKLGCAHQVIEEAVLNPNQEVWDNWRPTL